MKTSKRVSALLIASCLLIGMMVPMVSASGEVATKTVTYDFDYYGICMDNGLEWNTNSLAENRLLTNLGVYYNGSGTTTAGNEVEDVKYLNWNYKEFVSATTTTACDFMTTGFFRARSVKDDYVVFEIDSPGAGDWTVSADVFVSNRGAKKIDVYMLSASETDIANNLETSIGYFSCDDSNQTTKDKPTLEVTDREVGTWKDVKANTKYFLVLKVTEGYSSKYGHIFLSGLTMTQTYSDSNKAAAAMGEDGINTQITLKEDLSLQNAVTSVADVVVDAGVELDLAGKDLTAKSVSTAPGAAVIDSADGVGLLKTALTANGDNGGYLPLTDSTAGGYRLCKPTLETLGKVPGDNGSAAYWFHAHFEKEAAYVYTGVEIGVQMTWDGGSKGAWAGETFMGNWATQVKADKDLDIKLTVTGLDSVTNFKLTPVIKANGVTISMDTL